MVVQFIYQNVWNVNNYLFYFLTKSFIAYEVWLLLFLSKICSSFPAAPSPHPPCPPYCHIYFSSLIIKFPLGLLPALSPLCLIHCILTTCKVWHYWEHRNIGHPQGHAFFKNMVVSQKAPSIQIFLFFCQRQDFLPSKYLIWIFPA